MKVFVFLIRKNDFKNENVTPQLSACRDVFLSPLVNVSKAWSS